MSVRLETMLTVQRTAVVTPDLSRMRRERHGRLQAEMTRQGVEVALVLHGPNVTYAAGQALRGVDLTHANFQRPVAIVVVGEQRPHLLWDGIDPALDVERHPAVWAELDEGATQLSQVLAEVAGPLAGRRVAVDEQTGAMLRAGVLDGASVLDASQLMGAVKLTKTADELACIAEAQRRNEQAMLAVREAARPGTTRNEVAGAFLARLYDLGVEASMIDPIFQLMPRSKARGPRTTTGSVAFPTGVGDPIFSEGDLVWVDTGVDHCGYVSDFGRTWLVGRDPNPAEQRLFARWCEVMISVLEVLGPGVTGGDLCRAAESVSHRERPWLPHFYLAHGVGVESAEMPLVGTDLGREFDDSLVMDPGMVLVFEPVVWEDGVGGYRAEEVVAVTENGWCHLGGGHSYAPFAA